MKIKHFIFSMMVFSATMISSCAPDQPPAPTDDRDVYIAHWTLNEQSSQIGPSSYIVNISKSTTNAHQVFIENFYNLGPSYKATTDISGTTVTIPQQTLNANQLHGSGTKSGTNTISLTYYMNNGSTIDTCTATLTRQ